MPLSPRSAHALYSSSATRRGESPRHRQGRIEYRQPERDNGNRDGNDRRRLLRAEKSDAREHEPDEEASRIAEEDRRRVEVEEQEAGRRAGEDDRDGGGSHEAIEARHDEHRREREERRAGRQPIEAVDEVERVRNAYEPDDREQHADDAAKIDHTDERQRQCGDTQAGDEHAAGDRNLGEKLPSRAHGTHVVDQAENVHRERPADHRRHPAAVLGEHFLAEERHKCRHGHANGEDDRDPADARDGVHVDFAIATRVDQAGAPCELSHHERQRR
jgi:hypothetical protein